MPNNPPEASEGKPDYAAYICQGAHCKCMNPVCKNYHQGDHTCPGSTPSALPTAHRKRFPPVTADNPDNGLTEAQEKAYSQAQPQESALADLLSEFGARYHVAKSGNDGWDGPTELRRATKAIQALLAAEHERGREGGEDQATEEFHKQLPIFEEAARVRGAREALETVRNRFYPDGWEYEWLSGLLQQLTKEPK